ncbi:hypothetical protein BU15DRAFT_63556 [Melanogaster broomeanus]|nr:hypothetical protein BU15DRAFT_63556 [Melanogaster broomeanus]
MLPGQLNLRRNGMENVVKRLGNVEHNVRSTLGTPDIISSSGFLPFISEHHFFLLIWTFLSFPLSESPNVSGMQQMLHSVKRLGLLEESVGRKNHPRPEGAAPVNVEEQTLPTDRPPRPNQADADVKALQEDNDLRCREIQEEYDGVLSAWNSADSYPQGLRHALERQAALDVKMKEYHKIRAQLLQHLPGEQVPDRLAEINLPWPPPRPHRPKPSTAASPPKPDHYSTPVRRARNVSTVSAAEDAEVAAALAADNWNSPDTEEAQAHAAIHSPTRSKGASRLLPNIISPPPVTILTPPVPDTTTSNASTGDREDQLDSSSSDSRNHPVLAPPASRSHKGKGREITRTTPDFSPHHEDTANQDENWDDDQEGTANQDENCDDDHQDDLPEEDEDDEFAATWTVKRGAMTREEKAEARALGEKIMVMVNEFARKVQKSTPAVMVECGLGVKGGRRINVANLYRAWYAVNEAKQDEETREQWLARSNEAYKKWRSDIYDVVDAEHQEKLRDSLKLDVDPELLQQTAATRVKAAAKQFGALSEAYGNMNDLDIIGAVIYNGPDHSARAGSSLFGGNDRVKTLIDNFQVDIRGLLDILETALKATKLSTEGLRSSVLQLFSGMDGERRVPIPGNKVASALSRDQGVSLLSSLMCTKLDKQLALQKRQLAFKIKPNTFPWMRWFEVAWSHHLRIINWHAEADVPGSKTFKSRRMPTNLVRETLHPYMVNTTHATKKLPEVDIVPWIGSIPLVTDINGVVKARLSDCDEWVARNVKKGRTKKSAGIAAPRLQRKRHPLRVPDSDEESDPDNRLPSPQLVPRVSGSIDKARPHLSPLRLPPSSPNYEDPTPPQPKKKLVRQAPDRGDGEEPRMSKRRREELEDEVDFELRQPLGIMQGPSKRPPPSRAFARSRSARPHQPPVALPALPRQPSVALPARPRQPSVAPSQPYGWHGYYPPQGYFPPPMQPGPSGQPMFYPYPYYGGQGDDDADDADEDLGH